MEGKVFPNRTWRMAVVALLVFALFLPLVPAHAALAQGFQISPPITELNLDPGTNYNGSVKVTNLTSSQISLRVSKHDFAAKGEDGAVDLVDDAGPLYSLAPWFVLHQSSVDVPPQATREVGYSIQVPPGAEPGGRYGSITFETTPPKLPTGESGASVEQRLAGLIFLRVNGDAREQLAIEKFTAAHAFYEYGPVQLSAHIKNLGNVHEKASGEVVIKNLFGAKVATIKLDGKNVIPGATRRFDAEFKRHWLLGRYTAELTVRNGAKQTLVAATHFTVLPYKVVLGAVTVFGIIILFFWKARRRLRRALRILAGKE